MKSLGKLVKVLECFSTDDRALSLSDICARTGFPRSTTHRLMASLRDVGFLDQDRERDAYRLGLKLFELGSVALSNLDIHREAYPFVDALERMTGHIVTVAIFDGFRAVVIRRTEGGSEAATKSNLIENAPAHCTSVGKASLAFQPAEVIDRLIERGLERFTEATITDGEALRQELTGIRERGYAVDEGEHQPGLRCIGAPIRGQHGKVFAGLSISGPSWQLKKENVEELAKVVTYHADRISRALGYVS
ncbi:DNA-binding IclR family transcriptional regulator [Pseudochelatococcus lubricantis]|uniref:DNA-binding IclR family transcriptional regulator n=1 Tax=Pseudochelatococcus lubricantis TaxID=1538102 RepID=A0ABX0V6Z3_9HYPH|nr:IclR family transcriptional regulator [Pseudochelatococcus lubricantis]NIJ60105.1 DNA-binding IclR family transcriptional regulator [Pseudochelatococcus lubricantis]